MKVLLEKTLFGRYILLPNKVFEFSNRVILNCKKKLKKVIDIF